jgi:hypothetical protein
MRPCSLLVVKDVLEEPFASVFSLEVRRPPTSFYLFATSVMKWSHFLFAPKLKLFTSIMRGKHNPNFLLKL